MMDSNDPPPLSAARMVHKYAVPIDDPPREIMMPWPSRILHVGVQKHPQAQGHIMFWAEVERAGPGSQLRRFIVRGTGHYVPPDAEWRGTVMDDPFVWHLYEIPPGDEDEASA